jgi:hypothetical protein
MWLRFLKFFLVEMTGLLFLHSQKTLWPVGQSVKTPPFHGGMRGSTPLRATKKILALLRGFFIFMIN